MIIKKPYGSGGVHIGLMLDQIPNVGEFRSRERHKRPDGVIGSKTCRVQKYLWCEVVEKTCTTFRFEYEYKLIKLRYFNHISRNSVIRYLNVSERTYCYWLDRVLITAERWAYELGVIKDE